MYYYRRTAGDAAFSTILQQMGGAGRLKAMLGATLLRSEKGLVIKFPNPQAKRGNHVTIEVEPGSDTYSMSFFSISNRGMTAKPVRTVRSVYAEDLVRVFEAQTGLSIRI